MILLLYFQHASNHQEQEALQQISEKRNRIEEVEDSGHQRVMREQKCNIYVKKKVTTRKHVQLIHDFISFTNVPCTLYLLNICL